MAINFSRLGNKGSSIDFGKLNYKFRKPVTIEDLPKAIQDRKVGVYELPQEEQDTSVKIVDLKGVEQPNAIQRNIEAGKKAGKTPQQIVGDIKPDYTKFQKFVEKNYGGALDYMQGRVKFTEEQKEKNPNLINFIKFAGGAAKGLTTAETGVSMGFLEAAKGQIGMAQRVGLSEEMTDNIVSGIDSWNKKSKAVVKDRNKIVDAISQGLGSQALYMIEGMGVAKLVSPLIGIGKVTQSKVWAKRIFNTANYTAAGLTALMESSGEAGAVYLDEKERWEQTTGDKEQAVEIAKGKADATFYANLVINLITNIGGGVYSGTNLGQFKFGLAQKLTEGAIGEGIQETLQQFVSNIAQDRPIGEGAKESAWVGALLGAFGAGGGNISAARSWEDVIGKDGVQIFKNIQHNQRGFQKVPQISLRDLLKSKNVIKQGEEAPKGQEAVDRAIKEIKNKKSPPIRVRQLEDGTLFIEDGLHRLEAYKQLGISVAPVEDVTSHYNKGKNIGDFGAVESHVSPVEFTSITDDKSIEMAEREATLLAELEIAKAGSRQETDGVWTSTKSTFPSWIPAGMRSNKLIKPVLQHIYSGTVPNNPAEIRLFNAVKNQFKQEFDKINQVPQKTKEIDVNKAIQGQQQKQVVAKKPVKRVDSVSAKQKYLKDIATDISTKVSKKAKVTKAVDGIKSKAEVKLARERNIAENKKADAVDKAKRTVTKKAMKRVYSLADKVDKLTKAIEEGKDVRRAIVEFANEHLKGMPEQKGKLLAKLRSAEKTKNFDAVADYILQLKSNSLNKKAKSRLNKLIKTVNKRLRASKKYPIHPTIKGILKGVTERLQGKAPTVELAQIKDFLEKYPEIVLPEASVDALLELSKSGIKNLSTEQLVAVDNAIRMLLKANQDFQTVRVEGKVLNREKVNERMVSNLLKSGSKYGFDKTGGLVRDEGAIAGWLRRRKTGFWGIKSLNMDMVSEMLDGRMNDMIGKMFYRNVKNGEEAVLKEIYDDRDFLRKRIWRVLKINPNFFEESSETTTTTIKDIKRKDVSIGGQKVALTQAQKAAIILTARDEDGRRHLLKGGFYLCGSELRFKITEEDLAKIEEEMNTSDKIVVNGVSEFFNEHKKNRLNEASMRKYGIEVATVENYFPITVHGREIKTTGETSFVKATLEGLGILKPRVKSNKPIVIDDVWSTVQKHSRKTSAFIGISDSIKEMKILMSDPEFTNTLAKTHGDEFVKYLNKYITHVEEAFLGTRKERSNLTVINRLENNLDMAILGLNPFVAMKQPASLISAATEIEEKYLFKALTRVGGKMKKDGSKMRRVDREMANHNPFLRDRFEGNMTREMGELAHVGVARKFITDVNPAKALQMTLIKEMDKKAIRVIHEASKLKVEATTKLEKGSDKYWEAVKDMENVIIERTQPTFSVVDRSELAREDNNWLFRVTTKYSTQRNKNYNNAIRIMMRAKNGEISRAKATKDLLYTLVIQSMFIMGVDELRDLLFGKKRKIKTAEDRARSFLIGSTVTMFGNAYYAKHLTDAIDSGLELSGQNNYYTRSVVNTPITSALNDAYEVSIDTLKILKDVIKGEEIKKSKLSNVAEKTLFTTMRMNGWSPNILKYFSSLYKNWVIEDPKYTGEKKKTKYKF